MSDAAWALQTARQVGPISPPHAHAHPIHKLHTGPLHSHVAGRTDHLPSNVPNGSYVLPADIVSALGQGNTMSGFKVAKRMFEGAKRHFGGTPYAGDNGPYGQGMGTPYGMADGGSAGDGGFNKWFAGSAAVNADGSPMKLYHGTTGDFSSFDKQKVGSNPEQPYSFGFHLTTRPQEASTYADSIANSAEKFNPKSPFAQPVRSGANVMPVYASVKNPLVVHSDQPAASMTADMDRADIVHKLVHAKRSGNPYDGVIIHRHRGDEYDHSNVIVFEPNQIKSAIGNKGTFNPNDPDITKASGGQASGDQGVPVAVAGGEHVLAPHEVAFAGMGDLDMGHRALDEFVLRQRAKTVKTLKGLPGPKRD